MGSIDDVTDDPPGSVGVEGIVDTFFLPPGGIEYSLETIVGLYPESERRLWEESADTTGTTSVESVCRGGTGG